MIGIIASTKFESEIIISALSNKKDTYIQNKLFISGYLINKRIVIGICGIGKANAAHSTSLLIEKYKPHIILNIGVAGAYPSSGLKVGDLAVAEKEIYGDEGLIAKKKDRRQKSGVTGKDEVAFYTMEKLGLPLAEINRDKCYNEFPMFIPHNLKELKKGNFITISSCTGTLQRGKEIEKRFNAICENMEGAAVAHISFLANVYATEIRGISNIIEDRMPEPLKRTNVVTASRNCQNFLIDYFMHSDL
jgi:futalosine hydrolase